MDISSLDLTSIGIAGISAGSALAGVALGPILTARTERGKRSSEVARARWAQARDAYIDLLTRASAVEMEAHSAVATSAPRFMSGEDVDAYLRAVVLAELVSTPEVWAEMEPYLSAVVTRISALAPGVNPRISEQLRHEAIEDRLFDPNEIGARRQRFVAAARSHLRQEPRQK